MSRGSLLFTSKKNPVLVVGGIQNPSFGYLLEANLENLHVPGKKTCHVRTFVHCMMLDAPPNSTCLVKLVFNDREESGSIADSWTCMSVVLNLE